MAGGGGGGGDNSTKLIAIRYLYCSAHLHCTASCLIWKTRVGVKLFAVYFALILFFLHLHLIEFRALDKN